MESGDVKRFTLSLAVQAEIDGMKAENENRRINGITPVYFEEHFYAKAGELRNIAHAHADQL